MLAGFTAPVDARNNPRRIRDWSWTDNAFERMIQTIWNLLEIDRANLNRLGEPADERSL